MNIDPFKYELLIIEDNPGDYTLVEDFLYEQINAPDISHAASYKSAHQLLANAPNDFHAILLDLSLPDKQGEDLIRSVVQLSGGAPVIVLTGYADFDFGIKSLSLGVADYLLKDELTALTLYKSIVYCLERHRFGAALEDSEQKYNDLFHLSPVPMWVYDRDSLAFLDVNYAAIQHYGFSKSEFLAMTLHSIRPEEEFTKLHNTIAEIKSSRNLNFSGIFKHRKKNGEIIMVDIRSNTITFQDKQAQLILATDITDRVNYIQAIEEQNRRLQEISWLQSHVIRAPLSRIMGLVSLLQATDKNASDVDQILKYLSVSADELDDVIKNIVISAQVVNNNDGA